MLSVSSVVNSAGFGFNLSALLRRLEPGDFETLVVAEVFPATFREHHFKGLAAQISWSRSSTHTIRHRTTNSRKKPPPHPIPAAPGSTPSFHGAHNWMSPKPTRRLRILGTNASLPRETGRPDPKTHRSRWYRQRRFSPDRLCPAAIMLLQVPEGPRRVFTGKCFQ